MNAGLPTALAVSSVIAVGTSHGLVLVFGSSCLNHLVVASLPLATAACVCAFRSEAGLAVDAGKRRRRKTVWSRLSLDLQSRFRPTLSWLCARPGQLKIL